ncbi:MAG: LacI family transcriptional regulator [bacterium]|nr:LacI family transcriptional regulator [bacterium]
METQCPFFSKYVRSKYHKDYVKTLDTYFRQLLEKPIDGLLFEPTGGYQNIRDAEIFRMLRELTIPVVAAALRAYPIVRKAGLTIPDDMSIMGYDDADFAARVDVPLTSVVHPKYQIGKWAAKILFDEIAHDEQRAPHQMIIKPTLAVRDSVKSR